MWGHVGGQSTAQVLIVGLRLTSRKPPVYDYLEVSQYLASQNVKAVDTNMLLVGWSVSWLVGRSVGLSVSVGQSVGRSVGHSVIFLSTNTSSS